MVCGILAAGLVVLASTIQFTPLGDPGTHMLERNRAQSKGGREYEWFLSDFMSLKFRSLQLPTSFLIVFWESKIETLRFLGGILPTLSTGTQ